MLVVLHGNAMLAHTSGNALMIHNSWRAQLTYTLIHLLSWCVDTATGTNRSPTQRLNQMVLNWRRNRRRRGREEGGGGGGRKERKRGGKERTRLPTVSICVWNIVWQVHASPVYVGNASYYISCLLTCLLTWCVGCTASVGKHYSYRRHVNETALKGEGTRECERTWGRTKKKIRVEDTSLFKCHAKQHHFIDWKLNCRAMRVACSGQ